MTRRRSLLLLTVVMATLVVGPFYLACALTLGPVTAGLVLSTGPFVAALGGAPIGRLADRLGAQPLVVIGLLGMGFGSLLLVLLPSGLGFAGWLGPIAILTAGYAAFQSANNRSLLAAAGAEERGLVSALLSLSRNFGLISGAALMGALFAAGSGGAGAAASPESIAGGMRLTFALASLLIGVALLAAWIGSAQVVHIAVRPRQSGQKGR